MDVIQAGLLALSPLAARLSLPQIVGGVALAVLTSLLYYKWPTIREKISFLRHRRLTGCQRCKVHPESDGTAKSPLAKRREQAMKDGRMTFSYTQDFERYGKTWEERLPGKRTINTIELANIQCIGSDGFDHFPKTTVSGRVGAAFLGNGILIADGIHWKRSRELIKPLFARTNVANISVVEKHVDRLIKAIPQDGTTFDMLPRMKNLFTDISSEILFGESLDSQLSIPREGSQEFLQSLDVALRGWAKARGLAGKLRAKQLSDPKWKEACTKSHAFIDVYVEQALEAIAAGDSEHTPDESSQRDGYEKLVLLHEMARYVRDPLELRFQILNVFLPTRDTTGILLSNVFFQLARRPDIWSQLRELALDLGDVPLTFERLKSLLLFRYVLQETLRHIGPYGRATRTARTDFVLPTGGGPDGKAPLFVPRGATICYSVRQVHHHRDYWGDDADEFRPERWAAKKPTWEFLTFGVGPRTCPGQQAALLHATYVLVRLTKAFVRIENRDPEWEWKERATSMPIESWNGVKIALVPA